MIDRKTLILAAASVAAAIPATPAIAQDRTEAALLVEATTDHRRRGLSWSDGDPALDVYGSVTVSGVDIAARAVSTRNSARHGGADAAIDLIAGISEDAGPFTLRGRVIGHFFPGSDDTAYGELNGEVGGSLGPVQVDLSASYAPEQSSIGGDNLYLSARGSVGVPATPWTLSAHVGRSTGSVDDPVRANRLRPGGSYTDWGVSAEYVIGPATVGARYTGTNVRFDTPAPRIADRANSGDRIALFASFGF